MDEPTQNLFRPQDDATHLTDQGGPAYEDQTQLMGQMGQVGPLPPPDPGTRVFTPIPSGPPPEWPQPIWRRRGALIGAGLLVLVIAGLVVGIMLAAPGSPPTPANAAATLPAASTAPVAGKGTGRKGPKLAPGERLVAGTISTVANDQVTVTPAKGGNPVTVTTDGTTKFAGGATSVTDLHPGERVQMIVRNGTAVTIRARSQPTGG